MQLDKIIANESALKELMEHYAKGNLIEGKSLLLKYKAVQCATCLATSSYVQWMNWLIETNEDARKFYENVRIHVQQTNKI